MPYNPIFFCRIMLSSLTNEFQELQNAEYKGTKSIRKKERKKEKRKEMCAWIISGIFNEKAVLES